jgi:hypothetical protein
MTSIRVFAALLLAVAPAACTAVSTYPPTAGTTKMTPSVSPGPELMAGAIKEAHRVTKGSAPIVFNLPSGLSAGTWDRVARQLPSGARAMRGSDENVYSVQQLRLSGGTAEVDVIYPEHGVYQLMTVKFEGGTALPWRVQWAYRWVIPASMPVANDPMIAVEAAEAERLAAEQAAAQQNAAEATTAEATTTDAPATEQAAASTPE